MSKKSTGETLVEMLSTKEISGAAVPGSSKGDFARIGKQYMRELAAALGLKKGEFDVRFNAGGVAAGGDLTLHTDTLYVSISPRPGAEDGRFMWRRCLGRTDFSGQSNRWLPISDLADVAALASKLKTA